METFPNFLAFYNTDAVAERFRDFDLTGLETLEDFSDSIDSSRRLKPWKAFQARQM
jgi:hypothetical protein